MAKITRRVTGGQGSVEFTIDADSLTRAMTRAARPRVIRAIEITANELAREARREIRNGAAPEDQYPNIATGKLLRSIKPGKATYSEAGGKRRFAISVNVGVPYAKSFSRGRNPGSAPRQSQIVQWAQAKFKNAYEEAAAIAERVAAKIRRSGVRPRPFLRTATLRTKQKFIRRIERSLKGGG